MDELDQILAALPEYRERIRDLREAILANLIMVGEIPAPTFAEEARVRFIQDRFIENQMQNVSTDEMGNAVGIHPGARGERNILVVAHVDTIYPETVDHSVTVEADTIYGNGVGDNALGVASMVSLPTVLEHLGLELQSNLILIGTARSIGRGDLEGIRFFLENAALPLHAGVVVEGVQLGRLGYTSMGMIRGEVTVQVPEEYDWTRFGAMSAIQTMNEAINLINEIPLPRRPRTSIVLGAIHGGQSFQEVATEASLRLEVRSESAEQTDRVRDRIEDICTELSSKTGAEVGAEFFARRRPGGLPFNHPLSLCGRKVLEALEVEPRITASLSELSAFTDREIPALLLAITRGEAIQNKPDRLAIEPIYTGLAQLAGVVQAIDAGVCDED
jgi:acetylornithine deacetylase/succinyl-diaminopimelate desuccinylase-like protein